MHKNQQVLFPILFLFFFGLISNAQEKIIYPQNEFRGVWIATVVNIAAALVKLRWNGFGIADEIWANIILIIAVLLIFSVLLKNHNAAFPLPVAWAYFGIYQNLNAGEFMLLRSIALGGMAVVIGLAGYQLYRNRFSLLPNPK